MCTEKRLKELLNYDPITGLFIRVVKRGPFKKGAIAGSVNDGYVCIQIGKKSYKAHRLAFLYMTGSMPVNQVDHINRIRSDNRWENLRDVTHAENQHNTVAQSNSKSGIKGVYKNGNSWTAQIEIIVEGKRKNMTKTFKDKADAIEYRQTLEISFQGGVLFG